MSERLRRAVVKGWTTLSLKDDLVAQVDAFVRANDQGFTNRAEVVTAAVRQFLDGRECPLTQSELRRALLAVAATDPKTVADLLKALLAELDMRSVGEQRPARPHASTPTGSSKTDSTRRK